MACQPPANGQYSMGRQHGPSANGKTALAASQWEGSAGLQPMRRQRGPDVWSCRRLPVLTMSDSRALAAASDLGSGSRRRTWAELLGKWVWGRASLPPEPLPARPGEVRVLRA